MIRVGALLVLGLVAWLSLTPRPPPLPGMLPAREDLLAHVVMHVALAGALVIAWPRLWMAFGALGLAVLLEVGQLYVVGRTFDWSDLVANLVGAAIGSGAALYVARFIPPRWH